MDISKWLSIVKSIPKEKLRTDAGLREVFRDISQRAGKKLSDKELDNYVAQFRRMARTETPNSLLDKLEKRGVNKNEINHIKKRLKK